MPKAVHDLAQELLADPNFYPDKPQEEREKIAWATANSRVNSTLESNVIEFVGSQEPTYSLVRGSDGASMLVFRNARLARAEVNANRDEINPEGIRELAASIAGWPIDIEHGKRQICGTILAGRAQELDLIVDGVVWAERYQKEAEDIQSGAAKLSVEARADKAKCSICGHEFLNANLYCDHLRDRNRHNAVRRLSGLKGRGAAITRRPAGTDTGFDLNQIYVIASHEEQSLSGAWYDKHLGAGESINDLPASDFADSEGRRFPYKIHGKVIPEGWKAAWSAAHGGHTGQADESAIAKLRRDKPKGIDIQESDMELEQQVKDLQAKLDAAIKEAADREKVLADSAKAVAELTASYQALEKRNAELVAAQRRGKLSGLSDEEWDKQKGAFLKLPDDLFDLMASKLSASPPPPEPAKTPAQPILGKNGDGVRIVLG